MIPVRSRVKEQHRKMRQEMLARLGPLVETAFEEIGSLYNYGHYITESERLALLNKYSPLYKDIETLIGCKELEESQYRDLFQRFNSAMSDTVGHKATNNENFVESQLSAYSKYFDTVLKYPLDPQQRKAIVSLEDNVLVISSAGSGKTMTTVGKVRYLIDVQRVPANKILLITFTRKAAESLSERLGEKDLKCRTFHKLALDLIAEATEEKPTITPQDFSVQVYHELFKENPKFKRAIADYIINARYTLKDRFEYNSRQEYVEDRKKHGVQAFFKDRDGRPVFCKSDEESRICDFLGSRGVKFRYEEKYEFNTADLDHRQYCPDFSIYFDGPDGLEKRIYLEHFAVNEKGHCPSWFTPEEESDYLEGINWKRTLHAHYGTTLLCTCSAGFHKGDVFKRLEEDLQREGVVFDDTTRLSISRELERQEESILAMLTSFNFLLKSKGLSLNEVRRQASGNDRDTIDNIIAPFVTAYQKRETENDEIDFTDAIIRATELCNNGHRPDYDYILVDEFQDISLDRYRFLQALRRDRPLTKLFCVGDDWQSIYRFAGSDMSLFKQFEQYFGYTKKCLMETTYRFGEPAIEQSSKFILANPEQAVKNVRPFRSDAETVLDFLPTADKDDMVKTVKWLIEKIPAEEEILLLGRYNHDVNIFRNTDVIVKTIKDKLTIEWGDRVIDYMTVHKSKGLECENVIMINCNGGASGFPSQISDNPVLEYLLSEPDGYAYSEERRVFYVGITRAKKHTWVLYDDENPSPFVREFKSIPEKAADPIPESELCPKCHCGRIRVLRKGVAVNGNPYTVIACSNNKYGCDFQDTIFVNLNSNKRTYTYINKRNLHY